jgi:hypothetical protein
VLSTAIGVFSVSDSQLDVEDKDIGELGKCTLSAGEDRILFAAGSVSILSERSGSTCALHFGNKVGAGVFIVKWYRVETEDC